MKKVLIANRGEIAVRIIKAAHQLGIQTVVMLSELEKNTLAARLSDEVHVFKDGPLKNNYLNIDLIVQLCLKYYADSLHPGYGFLSENYQLAKACSQAGITFIGPTANNLLLMGDKEMARNIAQKAQVPLTQSWEGTMQNILSHANNLPFPVLIKAALGGGGKGMYVCSNQHDLIEQLPVLSRQAKRYFGDERLYVEQYIPQARHIEVQVLADNKGNMVHLFERECSIQRRFQKLIEEAPAIRLSNEQKQILYADALKLCKAINYTNAGTVEFLIDHTGQHYFLEMNTRIQVEHCVTEEITGIDLVQWQFRIAADELLSFNQEQIKTNGHAIELRICAEEPSANFRPSPGQINSLIIPDSKHCRLETGLIQPQTIHAQFDPLIAKLVAHAPTRQQAIQKALKSNCEFIIRGIKTNCNYLNRILNHPEFKAGQIHTRFCEIKHLELNQDLTIDTLPFAAAYAVYRFEQINGKFWRHLPQITFSIHNKKYLAQYNSLNHSKCLTLNKQNYTISAVQICNAMISFEINGRAKQFYGFEDHETYELIHQQNSLCVIAHDRLPAYQPKLNNDKPKLTNHLKAPLPSQVMNICVREGEKVKTGDLLLVLEAMKTENHIKAWKNGIIEKIHINKGDQVKLNQILINYQE